MLSSLKIFWCVKNIRPLISIVEEYVNLIVEDFTMLATSEEVVIVDGVAVKKETTMMATNEG